MPDPRFFEDLGPVTLDALAALTGAALADASMGARSMRAVAPLERADGASISFLSDRRYAAAFDHTAAGACFVRPDNADAVPAGCAALITREPQAAYAKAAAALHRPRVIGAGETRIDPTAVLEEDVVLAVGVVIGAETRIGRGTRIGANSVIGPGVCIGRDGQIGANATIGFALIGDRVRIFSGAVLGEPGFGVAGGSGGALDIPQLGRVILQDGVTVGACCCVDRGAWDDTVIGENTKLDNLVQIGHNTRLGRNCLIAAQTGISGSVVAGDGVRCGGQVGVADHMTIGEGATLMANAGVMNNVPAGETWGGFPAVAARRWLRQVVWLAKHAATTKAG